MKTRFSMSNCPDLDHSPGGESALKSAYYINSRNLNGMSPALNTCQTKDFAMPRLLKKSFIYFLLGSLSTLASIPALAGGEGSGGGYLKNGKTFDELENEGTTPFAVSEHSSFITFVEPKLQELEKIDPALAATLRRAVKERQWLIEPKKLQCEAAISMVSTEGAEPGACQDDFEVRVQEKDMHGNPAVLGRLFLHELVRFAKWEIQPYCTLEVPRAKARCEKEIRRLTNVLFDLPKTSKDIAAATKSLHFKENPTSLGQLKDTGRSPSSSPDQQNSDILGNLEVTKLNCQLKMPDWDEELEALYPKRDQEVKALREAARPVLAMNAKGLRMRVSDMEKRMTPEFRKQMKTYVRLYNAQKKELELAKDNPALRDKLQKALESIEFELRYPIAKTISDLHSSSEPRARSEAIIHASEGKVWIAERSAFKDPNRAEDVKTMVPDDSDFVVSGYDFISHQWTGAPDISDPSLIPETTIDDSIDPVYFAYNPEGLKDGVRTTTPSQREITSIEKNGFRMLCLELLAPERLKSEASSDQNEYIKGFFGVLYTPPRVEYRKAGSAH